MHNILTFMFSFYVWFVCFVWMSLICILTYGLLPLFPYKKTHDWIASPGFASCLWLIGCPITVRYDPRFNFQRQSVFCQNHVNLLDAFIASKAIPHVFCGLMHRWQFSIPIYGWMMRVSKGIPMDKRSRKDVRAYMTQQAQQRHDWGFSILTFPEGGRTTDGQVREFKRGVFVMAKEAGYPVVPIAVYGNFQINQKGSLKFKPGKIQVFVGPQFETTHMDETQIQQLTKRCEMFVRNAVEAMAA